jgi:hypothetical protein
VTEDEEVALIEGWMQLPHTMDVRPWVFKGLMGF